jgi:predicted ATP-binding protein involved in virulence
MHINSLNIEKHQILENLQIKFQIPSNNQNVVNIIAGVNGSGKTTLLKWISEKLTAQGRFLKGLLIRDDNIEVNQNNWTDSSHNYVNKLTKENKYREGIHSSPRVIYIPSNMFFQYQPKNVLETTYKFLNVIETSSLLGNAELFIKNYIITKERLSNKANPIERTKAAIDSFNAIFKDSELVTKLINLDVHNNNKPIFETLNHEKITIDKLSSGEQQLYARVVSLMILNPHNSVILIDEPEIALHPKWQIEIMKIYSSIGKNNQFIVATHSPFIITQTHYLNLTFLVREEGKIIAKQFTKSDTPPHRDINTLVKTIMGADYLPKELVELQTKYRKLFDKKDENNKEAVVLKRKILEWESPNSSFWQGISFDKELRDI